MGVPELSKRFLRMIEERVGPFDRPFQLRVFPCDAGGALNFLTVGTGRMDPFVTYVFWDLFGHEQQKRGSLGRYELLAVCDDEKWCLDVLTKIGRQTLQEVFEPGDTLDIRQWVSSGSPIQGIVFEEALRVELRHLLRCEVGGLLRCNRGHTSRVGICHEAGHNGVGQALKARWYLSAYNHFQQTAYRSGSL